MDVPIPMAPRIILCTVLATLGAAAAALPERFYADYSLTARGMTIGHTRLSLSPLGDGRFVYRSHSRSTGLAAMMRDQTITESSELRLDRSVLQPLRYRYDSRGHAERQVAVEFDWDKGVVHNTAMGTTWQMPVPAGTLDKLNYVLALMIDLAAGKREFEYRVADGGRLKTYEMSALRDEVLDTPFGAIDTIVMRRRRADSDRETTMWCAPSLHYLPVKVEHRESGGDVVSLTLDAVEGMTLPGEQ